MKTIFIILLTAFALGCGGYGSGSGSGSMAAGAPQYRCPAGTQHRDCRQRCFHLDRQRQRICRSVGCLLELHGAYHHIRDQQPAYRGDFGRRRRQRRRGARFREKSGWHGNLQQPAAPEFQHGELYGAVIDGSRQAPTGCRFSAALRAYTSCAARTAAPYSTGFAVTLASTCSSAARIPMVSR